MKKNIYIVYAIMGIGLLLILIGAYFSQNQNQTSRLVSQSPVPAQGVPHVTREGLYELLASGRYSFIEFGGRSCIPCRRMQPLLSELNEQICTSVNIYNVYLEDDPSLARDFRIQLIPTQIIFDKDGKEIFRHVGYWEKMALNTELRKMGIM
jgi:thioredoxin 1